MKKLILLLALSIVAFQPRAFAQADRATIAGQAVDSSGSAVVGAEVRIVNVDTNLTLDTVVNETGNYRFVAVPVGMYTLTATAPGFQTYERQNIQANGNQTTIVEIAFQVGAVSETVTVVAGAVPLISPESSEVGVVVESKKFLNLPLTLGGGIRNPSSFIKLAPGVASTSTWNKSINGGRQFDDETYFDGIALSRGDLSNDGEVNPSVDAIAEFKLISNNYSAEYSHAVGGITSFTLKSGTNQIHGTASFLPQRQARRTQLLLSRQVAGAAERMGRHDRRADGQEPHVLVLLFRSVLPPRRTSQRPEHAADGPNATG
ncbi:MAG: carboxypeptidase-like regulatory domain-containing protein [Bryobacterales bacterium]